VTDAAISEFIRDLRQSDVNRPSRTQLGTQWQGHINTNDQQDNAAQP
jgi:hypothetical protein